VTEIVDFVVLEAMASWLMTSGNDFADQHQRQSGCCV